MSLRKCTSSEEKCLTLFFTVRKENDMKILTYPFDENYILSKKKKIKNELNEVSIEKERLHHQ